MAIARAPPLLYFMSAPAFLKWIRLGFRMAYFNVTQGKSEMKKLMLTLFFAAFAASFLLTVPAQAQWAFDRLDIATETNPSRSVTQEGGTANVNVYGASMNVDAYAAGSGTYPSNYSVAAADTVTYRSFYKYLNYGPPGIFHVPWRFKVSGNLTKDGYCYGGSSSRAGNINNIGITQTGAYTPPEIFSDATNEYEAGTVGQFTAYLDVVVGASTSGGATLPYSGTSGSVIGNAHGDGSLGAPH